MKNSNLAERLEEFADVVARIDSPDNAMPRINAVAANTEMKPRPRPVPARRRFQIRDQGLQAFRVF
jgi:DNA-binding helix-hairpin-helix protein with protein kinase domain